MKKILFIILMFAFVGCTLEEKIISNSTPETYYQTPMQCRTGLNGCYIPLRSLYGSLAYFEVCEGASDLIYHSTSTMYNSQCDISQSLPRFGTTMWTQCYTGVMRCNAMYAAIERAPLTDEEKAPLFAECVILRAFYYYILTINFGDVPYYWEEVTDANNDKISQLPRMSAVDLRNELMDQLWYWLGDENVGEEGGCQQALPYIKTYDPSNEYRIGSMVGFVLAGKLAMWNKQWNKAIKFYKYVEDVYGCIDVDSEEGTYTPMNSLLGYSLADVKFRNRYTPESIFELPAYAKEYGLRVTSTIAVRCTPPRSSSETEGDDGEVFVEEDETMDLAKRDDIYNGIVIPELGGEARTYSPFRPTKYFYETLMSYDASKDLRTSVYNAATLNSNPQEPPVAIEGSSGSLAWCYSGWQKGVKRDPETRLLHWFSSVGKTTGRPFLGDKFWCPGMVYTQDSNNIKIFRFASVILDLAEAHMRMDDKDTAVGYLNATKLRAGVTTVNPNTEEEFMEELYAESGRELFGEFTRRHNLVRWGIWYDRVTKYSDSSRLKTMVKAAPCREYYPIPDKQIVLSNYNLDNKEYEKYGL